MCMFVQPIALGVSFFRSQITIDALVLYVSFTTFRWKETKEIEIGDYVTLQMQEAVHVIYGVALVSRIDKIIGLFYKRAL